MKIEEKRKAISMRKDGGTYNEIAKALSVSKGTLNKWLYGVNPDDLEKFALKARMASVVGGRCHALKWENKRQEIFDSYDPPLTDPGFMLGLGVYWGEGSKFSKSTVQLSNSDFRLGKIFIEWIRKYFGDFTFAISIHHYDSTKDKELRKYWEEKLNVSNVYYTKSQFVVSKNSQSKRKTLPFGTVHITLTGKGGWIVRTKIEKCFEVLSGCKC